MIKTKGLYIATIRTIFKIDETPYKYIYYYDNDNDYYVAVRKKIKTFVELFSGEEYNFHEGTGIGEKYVGKYTPIVEYMYCPREYISEGEISLILNKLNGKIQNIDFFLESVLTVNFKIMCCDIEENVKEQYISKLKSLIDEYISMMISLKNGEFKEVNNEINELKIKERFFLKLLEIENELGINKNIGSEDYNVLKKELMTALNEK